MNYKLYLWGYGLSIIEIYISLFGLVTNLINDSLIITNIKNYDILSKRNAEKYPMITPDEKLNIKIILPIILFIWLNFLLMALTDNILINLRINDSYHRYELAIEENRIFESQRHHEDNNQNNQTYESNNGSQNTQNNGEFNITVMNNNINDINSNNIMNDNLNNNKDSQNNSNIIKDNIKGSAVVLILDDNNQNDGKNNQA